MGAGCADCRKRRVARIYDARIRTAAPLSETNEENNRGASCAARSSEKRLMWYVSRVRFVIFD